MLWAIAVSSLGDSRADGPMARHLLWLQTSGGSAVALLPATLLALNPGSDSAGVDRMRALTCWLYATDSRNSPALEPLVPEAEREQCERENARLYAAYYGFLFAHKLEYSTRPPADYTANLVGSWRSPPASAPRVRVPAPLPAQFPEGTWRFTERLGRAGRPPACTSTGSVQFTSDDGQWRGEFQGLDACLALFPAEEEEIKAGLSAVYATRSAIHFALGGCEYSGTLSPSGEMRGMLRCDAGAARDGAPTAYRGTWTALRGL